MFQGIYLELSYYFLQTSSSEVKTLLAVLSKKVKKEELQHCKKTESFQLILLQKLSLDLTNFSKTVTFQKTLSCGWEKLWAQQKVLPGGQHESSLEKVLRIWSKTDSFNFEKKTSLWLSKTNSPENYDNSSNAKHCWKKISQLHTIKRKD